MSYWSQFDYDEILQMQCIDDEDDEDDEIDEDCVFEDNEIEFDGCPYCEGSGCSYCME